MNELSLHILDIVQNSIKANASLVKISVQQNTIENTYTVTIEITKNCYGPNVRIHPLRGAGDFCEK